MLQDDPCLAKTKVVGDVQYCDRYWECEFGQPELYDCPNGLVWIGKNQGIADGCDYPWRHPNICKNKDLASKYMFVVISVNLPTFFSIEIIVRISYLVFLLIFFPCLLFKGSQSIYLNWGVGGNGLGREGVRFQYFPPLGKPKTLAGYYDNETSHLLHLSGF